MDLSGDAVGIYARVDTPLVGGRPPRCSWEEIVGAIEREPVADLFRSALEDPKLTYYQTGIDLDNRPHSWTGRRSQFSSRSLDIERKSGVSTLGLAIVAESDGVVVGNYSCTASFTRGRQGYMDRWGGLQLEIALPATNAVDGQWPRELAEFLRSSAVL